MLQHMPGTRPRETRAEQTRKLLTAAFSLIPEVGIAGLRTRDIAKKAGVHLATFHYCFESKEALLEALFNDIVRQFTTVIDAVTLVAPDPRERLAAHRKLRRMLMYDKPRLMTVWQAFRGEMWTNKQIANLMRPYYRNIRERMIPIIEEGRKQGMFKYLPEGNPMIAAAMFVSTFEAVFTQMRLDPEIFTLEEFEAALSVLYGETPVPSEG